MANLPKLNLDTPLVRGVFLLFQELEARLELSEPVNVLIVGGIAMGCYSETRIACDVDVQFFSRILIPQDLVIEVDLGGGLLQPLYFDVGHNPNRSLMHQDYLRDAIPLDLGLDFIRVKLLAPVDLVVSKIARLSEVDRRDIAELVRLGLVTPNAITRRASEAMGDCICNISVINGQLQTVLELVEAVKSGESPAH